MRKIAAALAATTLAAAMLTSAPAFADHKDEPKTPSPAATCEQLLEISEGEVANLRRYLVEAKAQTDAVTLERDDARRQVAEVAAERDALAATLARKQNRIERLEAKLAAAR